MSSIAESVMGKKFVPNWESRFPDADKAMLYAIALTMKMVPGAVVTWKGQAWEKETFDRGILKEVKELL